jgi:3-phenylpropionate/trans-cinnamate dioxygenase ferredoxin reductase subunit
MADSEAPSGPDLGSEGIPADELQGGALAAGSYQGNRVVVVQAGSAIYALDGSCSHYGAPLDEGIFDGECIRCPWHHSRFEVATGRPFAPAYKPLTRYATQVRDGKVFVTGPLEAPALAAPTQAPDSVVIVGGGAAGHFAAETLRAEGYGGPITILSSDDQQPYDRPNVSKDYLAGTAQPDWMPLREPEFYTEHNIDVRTATNVSAIDAASGQVSLTSGERVGYGALLLATGAEPVRLPLPGMDLPHVHTLRSMSDCDSIVG